MIVGIAGGTASGKSTLARGAAEVLGWRALLITHDQYYFTLPEAHRHHPVEYNFDHPSALDTAALVRDLSALRAGRHVRLPEYDFSRHQRAPEDAWTAHAPRDVILVEGILVLSDPQLRDCFDLRVFVDAPDDVRLVRRLRRDLRDRGREVGEVLSQYERTVRPMHERYVRPSRQHAQVVIDGTGPEATMVEALLAALAARGKITPPLP